MQTMPLEHLWREEEIVSGKVATVATILWQARRAYGHLRVGGSV